MIVFGGTKAFSLIQVIHTVITIDVVPCLHVCAKFLACGVQLARCGSSQCSLEKHFRPHHESSKPCPPRMYILLELLKNSRRPRGMDSQAALWVQSRHLDGLNAKRIQTFLVLVVVQICHCLSARSRNSAVSANEIEMSSGSFSLCCIRLSLSTPAEKLHVRILHLLQLRKQCPSIRIHWIEKRAVHPMDGSMKQLASSLMRDRFRLSMVPSTGFHGREGQPKAFEASERLRNTIATQSRQRPRRLCTTLPTAEQHDSHVSILKAVESL